MIIILRSHWLLFLLAISNNKIIHLKNDAPGSWDEEWYPYKKGWRNYISKVMK